MTPVVIGTRLGPYEIVAKLGAGGMGEVYRAHDSRLRRHVAVKILPPAFAADPERVARFAREAQTLAALNHAHIAQIYGIEDTDGITALVMELVDGPTLAERIRLGPVPQEDAVDYARQIAAALEVAHEADIIHRDLKPANIKIRADGTLKVLDFGLAKSIARADAHTGDSQGASLAATVTSPAVTIKGVILGTAAYMSPEQARGGIVDRRADIWAFGCVLFEMLTGKQTFSGQSVTDVLTAVLRDDPDWSLLPAATPTDVRRLLQRCLERNPADRLRDIGEARYVLAHPGSDSQQAPKMFAPRHRSVVAAGGIAIAIVGTAAMIGWRAPVAHTTAPVVRFTVSPEPQTQFTLPSNADALLPQARLSPDGRWLAFGGHDIDGVPRLFLRRLDEVRSSAVPGTENADFFFWSPDSTQLAFFSLGRIKRVSLNGGPVQVVCCHDGRLRPEGSRGAAWRSDGVIAFATREGLLSVDNTLLNPHSAPLLTWSSDVECRYPEFSPDRMHVFVACTSETGGSGLFVARVGGRLKRISSAISRAILRRGRLLYVRSGTLVMQPFDFATMELTGEPTAIVDRFHTTMFGNGTFDVSGNGIVLEAQGSPDAQTFARFNRNGSRMSTDSDPGQFLFAQFSPATDYVTFDRYDPERLTRDVWVMKLDGGAPIKLTADNADDANPVWAPDGGSVFFVSDREPRGFFRKAVGGSTPEIRVAAFTSGPESTMAWPRAVSPDGRWLLYQTGRPWDLWVADLSGRRSEPVPVISGRGNDVDGQFSPAGNAIAYVSDESGREEVFVQSFPDGQRRWQISLRGGQLPRWRGDGKELYFVAPDGFLMAVSVTAANEFSTPARLFATGIPIRSNGRARYAPNRDGSYFVIVRMDVSAVRLTLTLNDPRILAAAN